MIIEGLDRVTGRRFRLRTNHLIYLLIIGLGVVLGYCSLEIYGVVLKVKAMQIANIVVTPILMGVIMHYLGRLKQVKGKNAMLLDRFFAGYLFALAFAVSRFVFTDV